MTEVEQSSKDSERVDKELRQKIAGLIPAKPAKDVAIPVTTEDTEKIVDELRRPENNNLETKLTLSAVTSHPVDGKRCQECIYYLTNREFCDLPEHKFPVEADWWCRLWRI